MPNLTETVRPLLREIDVLRGKESRLEKQLTEVQDAIEAKLVEMRNVVNAGTEEKEISA